ncbi:hypothetical protein N665_0357s0014 [Sinapis alba]|nr:hypothetical protein N665_0357s0014 [Sinapis alba]
MENFYKEFDSNLGRKGKMADLGDMSRITKSPSPVVVLSGEATMTLGSINPTVKVGSVTKTVEFLVIDLQASYNTIVSTPWLNSVQVVPSTFHLSLKFPTPHGIKTIWGNQKILQACFAAELKRPKSMAETSPKKKKKSASIENTP